MTVMGYFGKIFGIYVLCLASQLFQERDSSICQV
jgi:hypothetical protein